MSHLPLHSIPHSCPNTSTTPQTANPNLDPLQCSPAPLQKKLITSITSRDSPSRQHEDQSPPSDAITVARKSSSYDETAYAGTMIETQSSNSETRSSERRIGRYNLRPQPVRGSPYRDLRCTPARRKKPRNLSEGKLGSAFERRGVGWW